MFAKQHITSNYISNITNTSILYNRQLEKKRLKVRYTIKCFRLTQPNPTFYNNITETKDKNTKYN